MKATKEITKNGARRKLTAMKQRGEAMLAATSINDTVLDTWSANCAKCVEEAFGFGNDHVHQFQDIAFAVCVDGETPDPREEERERREKLQQRLVVLEELIAQLDMEETLEGAVAPATPSADILALFSKAFCHCRPRFSALLWVGAVLNGENVEGAGGTVSFGVTGRLGVALR
jgi:hypothetical protein